MLTRSIILLFLLECNARFHFNVTRTTLSGLASYRSSLTLDGLAVEDARQKAMVDMYENPPLTRCHEHPAPSRRKVGQYMLEMLRKLEGDNGVVIKEFIQTLIHCKILVEVYSYESEPDLDSLVKTPEELRAEPHTTFPRVMALVWMAVTDAENAKRHGWCSIDKVNRFLRTVEPSEVADHLRSLNIVMGRARLGMENFIQHFSALNIIYQSWKPVKVLFSPALCEPKYSDRNEISDEPCLRVHPSTTDIVKKFLNVLPYLDMGDRNAAFLAKYRATVNRLAEAGEPLDREAAFYAAALTPLIFLQNGRNSWCFLERRALRLYQNSRPSEKRRALELLHDFQTANQRAHAIIKALPAPVVIHRVTTPSVKEFLSDEKDLGYIEEIIKNFG